MNYRTGNLEFRRNKEGRPAEIVRWTKNGDGTEYCYTLLWYKRGSEGFYVEFVGRRPFDDDSEGLWELMEYGQDTLDAEFKLEESLKWK
jgi:hypothetical protein